MDEAGSKKSPESKAADVKRTTFCLVHDGSLLPVDTFGGQYMKTSEQDELERALAGRRADTSG